MEKRYLLAAKRGFCKGVENAVKLLEETIRQESGTVYIRKEIVHNKALVEHFKSLGAVIVDEVDDVPEGGVVVISAHGVAPSVREAAKIRRLRVVDATCPLVAKIHNEAIQFRDQGFTIILIGVVGHKEVIGVMGEAPDNIHVVQNEKDVENLTGIDGSRVAWLSQTTLNVDETLKIVQRLEEKYPLIQGPPKSDICAATKERQQAVKDIAKKCGLFIVVGSKNSSNTKRLAEVAAESAQTTVVRIDEPEELLGMDFSSVQVIGITSGVSVAEDQLMRVTSYIEAMGYTLAE